MLVGAEHLKVLLWGTAGSVSMGSGTQGRERTRRRRW